MFGTYRTFLALLVVALHLGGIPNIGAYAVFGFYCLSGYLMTLVMHSSYGYSPKGAMKYLLNRVLRIFPLYWTSVLFSALLIYWMGGEYVAKYHPTMFLPGDVSDLLRNIFLFFPFREAPRMTPPAWALTVELFYYIAIGFGLSKGRKLTLLWLLASIIYHAYAWFVQLGWSDRYFTIAAASLPFSAGAFIYHFKGEMLECAKRVPIRLYPYLPFFTAGAILANWGVGWNSSQLTGLYFYTNFILCAAMVLVLSERKHLPYISIKFDKWMGDFSYPIYLIHYQVGLIVLVALNAMGVELRRPDFSLMLVSIPVIFLFAWILTNALERPIDAIRAQIRGAAGAMALSSK